MTQVLDSPRVFSRSLKLSVHHLAGVVQVVRVTVDG